jgi:hypothetical protein
MANIADLRDAVDVARHELLGDALRLLHTQDYADATLAHHADDLDYRRDELALRARELVKAVDALPSNEWPVGWA